MHAIGAHGDDVADLAVLDALGEILAHPAVTAHQAHAHLEVLGIRLLGEVEHPPRRRSIDRHRLLHEHVQALLDGVGELDPAERRRRREDHDVPGLQGVHRLLVPIEPDELPVVRDVHLVRVLALQALVGGLQAVLEHVGHRHELHGAAVLHAHGVVGGARPAPARAHQRDVDGVALGPMHVGDGDARQRGGGGDLAGRPEEVATVRHRNCGGFVHAQKIPPTRGGCQSKNGKHVRPCGHGNGTRLLG